MRNALHNNQMDTWLTKQPTSASRSQIPLQTTAGLKNPGFKKKPNPLGLKNGFFKPGLNPGFKKIPS